MPQTRPREESKSPEKKPARKKTVINGKTEEELLKEMPPYMHWFLNQQQQITAALEKSNTRFQITVDVITAKHIQTTKYLTNQIKALETQVQKKGAIIKKLTEGATSREKRLCNLEHVVKALIEQKKSHEDQTKRLAGKIVDVNNSVDNIKLTNQQSIKSVGNSINQTQSIISNLQLGKKDPVKSSNEMIQVGQLLQEVIKLKVKERKNNVVIHDFDHSEQAEESSEQFLQRVKFWLSNEYHIKKQDVINAYRFGKTKYMRPMKVELSSKFIKAAILKENIKKRKRGSSRFYTITPDLPRELIIQNQLMRTAANLAKEAKKDVEQVKGQLSINTLNWKSTKYYEKAQQVTTRREAEKATSRLQCMKR